MKKINLNNSMQTLTQTTTKVISSTALIVATFVAFGAGAVALATVPVTQPSGSNVKSVKVYNCRTAKNGILIKANSRSKTTSLVNGCKKIGQTRKDYTYTCAANRKSYKARWKACATKTVVEKAVTEETIASATAEGLPDLAVEDVKFSADYGELTLNVVNKGTAVSPEISLDTNANPTDESGLRVIWQDVTGKELSVFGSHLKSLKPGEKQAFTILAAGGNSAQLDHIVIFVDKTNKVKETIEEDNNAFLEQLKTPLVVANCVDADAKTFFDSDQLFVKSATKAKGVEQKADYCVGNYLFEGICYNNSFTYWQKNCAELNAGKPENNFLCIEGVCVNQPK